MSTLLETPLAYCREKICPELSSLHYATVFQPVELKAYWLGLFTLNHELRQACLKQLEAGLTQVKLGWWRNALANAGQETNLHPVIQAISRDVVAGVDADNWPVLINQVAAACEPSRFENQAAWDHSTRATISPWLPLIAQKFAQEAAQQADLKNPAAYQALLDFWMASTQLCQLLRLAKYLDEQFQPIPIDSLRQHGVTAEQIRSRQHSNATHALFTQVAQSRMTVADAAWKQMPADLRLFCRPLRALYRMKVREFRLHGPQPALLTEQKALTPLRKFSISWTTQVLRA
ncbi:MAG TPA: squalene/phytoene synthase family protein [Limnobacter sp.]|uniref:squalene/phytoene synthase family protein n=1 Tax=Limnobacter sp. TaxID=2003368 RepID=UPI002ED9FB08